MRRNFGIVLLTILVAAFVVLVSSEFEGFETEPETIAGFYGENDSSDNASGNESDNQSGSDNESGSDDGSGDDGSGDDGSGSDGLDNGEDEEQEEEEDEGSQSDYPGRISSGIYDYGFAVLTSVGYILIILLIVFMVLLYIAVML